MTIQVIRRVADWQPVRNRTGELRRREMLVIRWHFEDRVGLGEASPLPGWGRDSLELAESELRAFDASSGPLARAELAASISALRSPSARFAIELAALDLCAQFHGEAFERVVASMFDSPICDVADLAPHATLVDMGSLDAAFASCGPAPTTLKLKLGVDLDRELDIARRVRQRWANVTLRFDANGSLGARAAEVLAVLADLGAEFIEEPVPPAELSALESPVPVALDESLSVLSLEQRNALYETGVVQGAVLKPMALGGLRASLDHAREAERFGVWSIASHLLTGAIARRGESALARLLGAGRAHGLGVHAGLRDTERLSVFAAARDCPDGLAVVDDAGALTWSELSQLVAGAMSHLPEVGRVAIEPRADRTSLVCMLAAMERGLPMVLLHPDASHTQKDARIDRLGATRVEMQAHAPAVPTPTPPRDLISPERTLALVFTSGTSGEAKIVDLSRRAMVAAAEMSAARLQWREDDRWLLSLPPAHVGGLSVIVRCLLARRPIVLGPPGRIPQLVRRHRVTLLSMVPTTLFRLVRERWSPPDHLRIALVGGAACSAQLRASALAADIPVATTYGLSETCGQLATRLPDDAPGTHVGAPLAGVELRIRAGLIEVRSPSRMSGYVGEPLADDEWFCTGDAGELDAKGRLTVLGRRSDLIVSGGENVYPAMLEPTLRRGCIDGVCVFGVADAEWGEVVAAGVLSAADDSVVRATLLEAASTLAVHERPRAYVRVPRFPTTRNGKIDRVALERESRGRLQPL